MSVYYNEFDPQAAAWIRELIKAGLIPAGDVDERSIEDVTPNELRGYTQCHFFAGIAGWAYALDLAGWPRDRPVWTGSCPCQPFSAAGKGTGFADERHLWPAWQHLIAQCRPPVVFGEQVASKHADAWIDLVHTDMEGMGYAFGCVPFPAAGVGAPHIRDRNYWLGVGLADANDPGLEGRRLSAERSSERLVGARGVVGGMAYTDGRNASAEREQPCGEQRQQPQDGSGLLRLGNAHDSGKHTLLRAEQNDPVKDLWRGPISGSLRRMAEGHESKFRGLYGSSPESAGQVNGPWSDADWLFCRDGKWRPVEPGTFPLAHGIPARVVRLRGYGNAIVPQAAAEFIRAYLESRASVAVAA